MLTLASIIEQISRELASAKIDCLLVGGFAVNYYGYTRNTLDVDFMMAADRLEAVSALMRKAGFIDITVEDNVVFFNAPGCPFRIDFLRVDNATMKKLLDRAIEARIFESVVKVPALLDLLAMKVFAFSQDPARRRGKDLADIAYLSSLHNLDSERDLHPLCTRFGSESVYDLIRAEIEALKTP